MVRLGKVSVGDWGLETFGVHGGETALHNKIVIRSFIEKSLINIILCKSDTNIYTSKSDNQLYPKELAASIRSTIHITE